MARRSCNIQQYFKQAANTAAAGNRPVATTLIISSILLTVRELTMSPRTPLCSDEAASLEHGQLAKHPNSKEQTVPPSLIPVKVPSETSNNISKHQLRLGPQPSNKKLMVTNKFVWQFQGLPRLAPTTCSLIITHLRCKLKSKKGLKELVLHWAMLR